MENIDLNHLSYDELCSLEQEIIKKKENFISLELLYIYDGKDNEPHLCYCAQRGYGTNPYYSYYYSIFCDVFCDAYVCENKGADEDTLLYYLNTNHINFENKRYNKEELATLWKIVESKLTASKLEKEQAILDENKLKLERE